MIDDERIPANARGKWSQLGVPHRGWTCVGTRDLRDYGEEYVTCEMCESQTIRYVHTMTHPEYPDTLECGCDCAGYMESNKKRALDRDKSMKNRAARRQKFPDRKGWKYSAKGTPHITVDSYHCMVTKRRGGYGVGITPPLSGETKWGDRTYKNVREAKEGCFDALEYMRENRIY